MTVNRKPTGTAASLPVGLTWGAAAALMMTILGCLLTAKLIDSEILSWNQSGYAVLMILLLSSWVGATVSRRKIRRRMLMVCLLSGVLYFLALMASTALFFGGQYSGVGETLLLIFCGSMLGFLSGIPRKTRRNPAKIRMPNC